jgi:hypothetical protein
MRRFFYLFCVVGVLCVYARDAEEVRATSYGADTKVVFLVKDDMGLAVSNAFVKAGFYLNGKKGNSVHAFTETNGMLVAEKKSVGEINYWIDKEGYYETSGRFNFVRNGVSNGRWQPYGATNTVVLKRKLNPVAMCVRRGTLDRLTLPKLDDWTGFDLECADWVSPLGKGKHEDFRVLLVRGPADNRGVFSQFTLTFRFPAPFDGVYVAKKDNLGSALKTVYQADTNHMYESEIAFSYGRIEDTARGNVIVKDNLLAEDDYLVLRIRSVTDLDGRLIKANYAKIYAPIFAAWYGFQMTTYFNPNANDPNLEADTAKNLRDPRDLGFVP